VVVGFLLLRYLVFKLLVFGNIWLMFFLYFDFALIYFICAVLLLVHRWFLFVYLEKTLLLKTNYAIDQLHFFVV